MVNKRGQVTIFIIIAVILIATVSLYFVFRDSAKNNSEEIIEITPIVNFVQECVDESALASVYYIGQHGGYYLPEVPLTPSSVPFYFYEGKNIAPSKEYIESELSEYVESAISDCVGNFESFEEFEIDQGEIGIVSKVTKDRINFELNYPLSIRKGEETSRVEDFESEVSSKLGLLHESSKFIVSLHERNPNEICINCLSEMQDENGIEIRVDGGEGFITYNLIDPSSDFENLEGLEEGRYTFKFAVGY